MSVKPEFKDDFDEPLVLIYDPRYPAAAAAEWKNNPLADFDRPMMVVDAKELVALIERGDTIEFV